MRYTRIALLVFGFGLLLGLVVVVAEIKSLERVVSGLMALGIVAIPIGVIADWRRAAKAALRAPRRPARTQAGRRPRRSAPSKR
jgi:ABC-type phosphate transport system permease subunit